MKGRPRGEPLAKEPAVERVYDADRGAMLAALRVVLGLPKKLGGDSDNSSGSEDSGGVLPTR